MTPGRSGRGPAQLLIGGFAIGLLVRYLLLFYGGTPDVGNNVAWGSRTLAQGLARGYQGIYFPFQYQLFAACAWVSEQLHAPPVPVYKGLTLLFEVAAFWTLVRLLVIAGTSPLLALVYWLHPWFLAIFALGYVDAQFTCLFVVAIALLHGAATRSRLILAGVPLAFAMLMKPHAVMPFVALGIYAAAAPSGSRARALLWTLMPTGVLLVVYEIYFAVALMPAIGGVDALLLLPRSYAGIADSQPILNGHMPNVWYPVAWALARPGQDVWDVPSTMALVAGIQIRQVALAITVAVIAWFSFREARRAPDREPAAAMLTVCAFASFVVPALMTSAHENHPYLSSVLLLPFVALGAPAIGRAAYHAWVALLCLNVEAIYAVDPIGRRFKGHYPIGARVVVAVVAVVLSALIVRAIVGAAPERSPGRA